MIRERTSAGPRCRARRGPRRRPPAKLTAAQRADIARTCFGRSTAAQMARLYKVSQPNRRRCWPRIAMQRRRQCRAAVRTGPTPISRDVLPLAALDERVAMRRHLGSGQTYAAKSWSERLLEAGARSASWIRSVWWGLRPVLTGTTPGYPVVVFVAATRTSNSTKAWALPRSSGRRAPSRLRGGPLRTSAAAAAADVHDGVLRRPCMRPTPNRSIWCLTRPICGRRSGLAGSQHAAGPD